MSQTKNKDSFFQDGATDVTVSEMIYPYHFNTLQEMRALLSTRLQMKMTDEEILEAVKTAFRNKPAADSPESPTGEIVDFIYEM